jgi:hypothetical protein
LELIQQLPQPVPYETVITIHPGGVTTRPKPIFSKDWANLW